MTLTEPAVQPESARAVAVRRWRAGRIGLAVLAALVLVTLAVAALRPQTHANYLDPAAAGGSGTRAYVQILAQRGVTVRTEHDSAALAAAPGTLVVVARPDRLTATDLGRIAALQGDLLLLDPQAPELAALAPSLGLGAGVSSEQTLDPGCADPGAQAAGPVGFGPGSGLLVLGGTATTCYPDRGQPRLATVTAADHQVTVLTSGLLLTNDYLDHDGNAALGVNLVGGHTTVIWYFPDLPKPGSADRSFGDLIPSGVKFAAFQLVIALLLVAAWRMRRFGPIVVERLPVPVRSAETVEGRARLYQGNKARGRAGEVLRAATLNRILPALELTRDAQPAEVVQAIRTRFGGDPADLYWRLYGAPPGHDAELVQLSDALAELEQRIFRPAGGPPA